MTYDATANLQPKNNSRVLKMVRVGSRIKITSDNDSYKPYIKRTWQVSKVYHNSSENPLYDMGVYPQKLVECHGLPFALYEYEFEVA
jgi:hypothetical protein